MRMLCACAVRELIGECGAALIAIVPSCSLVLWCVNMPSHLKSYLLLSDRQKRRRKDQEAATNVNNMISTSTISENPNNDDSQSPEHLVEEQNQQQCDEADEQEPELLGEIGPHDFPVSGSHSEDEPDLPTSKEIDLRNALIAWTESEVNVPAASVNRLLKGIHSIFPSIPKDVRSLPLNRIDNDWTLKRYPDGSEYIHINSWPESLKKFLLSQFKSGSDSKFTLAINIDGLPPFDGSPDFALYPILVRIQEYPTKIFTAGIYCKNRSHEKMIHPDQFLEMFIADLKVLFDNAIVTADSELLTFEKSGPFICDSPCRSDLKKIVANSGYSSCERCTIHGSYHGHHVTFDGTNYPLRTKASFAAREDPRHHKQDDPTSLELLGIDMTSQFVLDSMHLVYIGVVKRLLKRWISSPKCNKGPQLGSHALGLLASAVASVPSHIPREFSRKLQYGISKLSTWKATEYRLFLLYVAPVILKNREIVSKQHYENVINLSVAIRILSTDNQEDNIDFVAKILKNFIQNCIKYYNPEFIAYNVHCLEHLPEDYLKYGNISKIDAFPFESYLGRMKLSIKSGHKPLQQVAKFVTAKNAKNLPPSSDTFPLFKRFLNRKYLEFKSFTIVTGSIGAADNCILLKDGSLAIVEDIILNDRYFFKCKKFKFLKDLFKTPIESRKVGIFVVWSLDLNGKLVPVDDLHSKCVLLPMKEDNYCALKLIHTVV